MLRAERLANIPFLAALAPGDLDELARTAHERRCDPRDVLLREGEAGDCVYLIVSGVLVASAQAADGEPRPLSTMGPGEAFGEIAVLDGRPRSATVTAATEAELLVIQRSTFVKLVRSSTGFGLSVMALMAERLRRQSLPAAVD